MNKKHEHEEAAEQQIVEDKLFLKIQAVVIYDDNGNYFIHGSNKESPAEMLKAMAPLWNMDPATEGVRALRFDALVERISSRPKVRVYDPTNS